MPMLNVSKGLSKSLIGVCNKLNNRRWHHLEVGWDALNVAQSNQKVQHGAGREVPTCLQDDALTATVLLTLMQTFVRFVIITYEKMCVRFVEPI